MEQVRLGIIGGGKIAELSVLGYTNYPRCRIVAVSESDPENARARQEMWGAERAVGDYREILEANDIDAVEILAPHRFHHQMVLEAAAAGKHVSVQKPMCLTISQAEEMVEACRKAGVKLRLFENFIFYPPYLQAREIVDAGGIGEPLSINIKLGNGAGSWWTPFRNRQWRPEGKGCEEGVSIYDEGFHRLAIARSFFGEIDTVRAWIDITMGFLEMPAIICWRHRNNRLGVWDITSSPGMMVKGKYSGADERVEIMGDQGFLWVTRFPAQLHEQPPLYFYHDGITETYDHIQDDWSESYRLSGHDFIDAIIDDRPPVLSGEDGLELIRFWVAIERSWKEDREVGIRELEP